MRVDFYPTAPSLRRLVANYYELSAPDGGQNRMRAEGPQLRCVLQGGGFLRLGGEEIRCDAPNLYLIGPTTRAYDVSLCPGTLVFGAALTCEGWHAAVGERACDLADKIVPYATLFPRGAQQAAVALAEADGPRQRVAAADAFCAKAVRDVELPGNAAAFVAAADSWIAGGVPGGVDALTKACGLSLRQTERLAKDWFGAGPKLLHRKARTLRTADRLAHAPHARWSDIADPSYTDQSHMIREFRHFIGYTPGDFARREGLLIKETVRARDAVPKDGAITFLS